MATKRYFQIILVLILSCIFSMTYAKDTKKWQKVEAVIKINILNKNDLRTHNSMLRELLRHSQREITDVVEDDKVSVKTLQITYPVKESAKNITQNSLLKLCSPKLLKKIDQTILEGADRIFIKYNKSNPEEIKFIIDGKDYTPPPMMVYLMMIENMNIIESVT